MTSALPRAVIFDWDNTLVDSWDAIGAAMNAALAHFGKPAWNLDEVHARCTRAAKDYFPEIFGAAWEQAFEIYYRAFDSVRAEHAARALLGTGDLLRWLDDRKIPAFVVSNKSTKYLLQEAEALKWTGHFVALLGAQDVKNNKPAREAVDLALTKGGMKADDPEIWFVGDTAVDVECARNSGCSPVLIGSADQAADLGVTLVFPTCRELLDHLIKG